MVRRKQIRAIVERVLGENRIRSAPVPVEKIAKSLGAQVRVEPVDDDELSGFLYREAGNNRAIIGVNADQHPNRRNFTIAHELGHFLLHDVGDVHVDRRFRVWLRAEMSSKGTDLEEKEANLFAAELLMPEAFIAKDIAKIGSIDADDEDILKELAEKYAVSTQAMTFRLSYLKFIDQ